MEQKGLSSHEAKRLLLSLGKNELPSKKSYPFIKLLASQFRNLLFWLLFTAGTLSFVVGDILDGFLILVILMLNTSLGFWQEYKASKELEELRKLEVASSRVIRDGIQVEIPSYEIVPGDIVILESGDRIPADGTLIETHQLTVNESALTGESLPVIKTTKEEENKLFFGTTVSIGRGIFRVEKTGVKTKFGAIALTLSNIEDEKTPLEISLNRLAKTLGFVAIIIAVLVFGIRVSQGYSVFETLTGSIALMVAAVPEGLPTVVIVMLAFGARKMYSKKSLVRKMSAVETLGATSVICTDKTGTLTLNEMSVRKVVSDPEDLKELLRNAVICNSSSLVLKEDHGTSDILGDTMEGALLVWAKGKDVDYGQVRSEGKLIEEEPFDAQKRRMSVIWESSNKLTLYSKGAPESILPLCSLSDERRKKIEHEYKELAKDGLRVLAFCKLGLSDKKSGIEKLEKDMDFLGLVGIADSPRPEAKEAISKARSAGISIVMVTGDNELTAESIGREIGLLEDGDEILTGAQVDELTEEELKGKIAKVRIFARSLPEHKLRIVKAYQSIGKVVAVTGDGVNDSLALKQAHVGVAMGITGTDVAKEASDIIILDDNLSTIVSAVEEGRRIYNNIFKVVKFLSTGNLSEVAIIVSAALLGLPAPFLASQLLWINFVTDGLPALSLVHDTASENTMKASPRNINKALLDFEAIRYISFFGFGMAAISLACFIFVLKYFSLDVARSAVFSTIVVLQMGFILFMRRHHSLTSNKYLLISVGLVLLSQVIIILFL